MPRPLSSERGREFQELCAFLEFFYSDIKKISFGEGHNPATVLANMVERYGKSKALTGLRQVINDVLEEFSDLPIADVLLLDEQLRMAGLVSFTELRRRYSLSLKRVVQRGSIRSDTEYYLLRSMVVNQGNGVADDERIVFERMLNDYECSAKK